MKKIRTFGPIFLLLIWTISLYASVFLILADDIDLVYRGFAVDSCGKLYLGKSDKIEVWENGTLVNTLSSMTRQNYSFTIVADRIVLSTASEVYEMTLTGEVTDQYVEKAGWLYYRFRYARSFIAENGQCYTKSPILGRFRIMQRENVFYQMPAKDYFVKIALIVAVLGMWVWMLIMFFRYLLPMIKEYRK